MIDPNTGKIQLPFEGLNISPALQKTEFQRSEHFRNAEEVLIKGSYASWAFDDIEIDAIKMGCCLHFAKEKLTSVTLIDSSDAYGDSWTTWSEENERMRKESHDKILIDCLGRNGSEYDFPWGSVVSLFDPKSGTSKINVTYKLEPGGTGQPM